MGGNPVVAAPTEVSGGSGTPTQRHLLWLVIPLSWILILGVLEIGLRIAGFGHSSALFLPVDSERMVDNADYTRRFYSLYDHPELVQKSNFFASAKEPGRLRVFVIGGSTAQGYPFQRNHSFSAIAQSALREGGIDVEVLNTGNSAMTSYYLREALHDINEYQPDFVAVYAGHNEYYGTPSMFTGGSHVTRLAMLQLRRYRTVQLVEAALGRFLRRPAAPGTLMTSRFEEGLFPPDSARDREVAELFIRNLEAGLEPLTKAGVPTAIFEPVSNLVDMPPFRDGSAAEGQTSAGGDGLADEYRRLREVWEGGAWDQSGWIALKDRDAVPFRARSVLTDMLEPYVASSPAITWIDTSGELEAAAGMAAFTDALFIDHLHFNFDGQLQLARMLAYAVAEEFRPGDEEVLRALDDYFSDPERVRAAIHLTAFWEFEAYTRVASLQAREPFASMPLAKSAPPVPERIMRNSLFAGGEFVEAIRDGGVEDLFFMALDYYRATGNRDEWVRNLNAYVQVYPGHYESHLAYAGALLEDDARANLDLAGSYIRTAYLLSGRDPEIASVAQQAIFSAGLGAIWGSFEARYLADE